MKTDDSGILNWAITLLLLGIVSVVFSFGGTVSEMESLFGRIAALSCLILALAMFVVYIRHRHRHPGAS